MGTGDCDQSLHMEHRGTDMQNNFTRGIVQQRKKSLATLQASRCQSLLRSEEARFQIPHSSQAEEQRKRKTV